MALERVVRIRVPDAGGGDRFAFGSGYLVAPGRVLTAAHVLIAPGRDPPTRSRSCEILCSGHNQSWLPADLLWVEPALDLAVVGVEAGAGLAPVRFGRVEGDEPLLWSAVGYPVASLDEAGRQPEHAWGETSAITQAPARKLGLTVNSRHARPSGAGSGWAGLSGAAVLCDRRIVGVVIADPSGYEASLVARRLEAVAGDPSLHEALHEALGISMALEAVSGRPMEPGLRDLRVLLPGPVATFTGRAEELRWLAETRKGPVVVTQALAGLGGVGKTALALEYAHRCFYAEHSVDLAWWFAAADRLSLSVAMAHLYEQLTGVAGGEDSVLTAQRLRNWLETNPYRWLVVFDNADTAGVLDGLVPQAGTGQVLITSRRPDWSLLGASVRRLDVLPSDDSVALLHAVTGRDDDKGALLVAEELDGLAVALQQAGAFVRKTGWDYERYLEMLRTRPLSLYRDDLAGVGRTVAKVWESSLSQVTGGEHYGTLAGDVLGVLAYLAADDIPRFLLQPPATDEEAVLGGGDPLAVELALVGLADYSLLRLEAEAIGLHRLVQHLTRVHLEGSDAAGRHVAVAVRLLRAALAVPGRTAGVVSRLLPHVEVATDHAARLSAVPEETVSLLNAAAVQRLGIGQLDIARLLLDRAVAVASERLGSNHPATLTTGHNLAWWLGESGRPHEAVSQSQAVVENRCRVLGPDHPDTLESRGSLAWWLGTAGRVNEAIAQFQALLKDRARVLGPDHPDTLGTRGNLAWWLGSAGRVDDAGAQIEALFEDCRRFLGPDHPGTLEARHLLALWLGEVGKPDEAVSQFQPLVDDYSRVLGPDHPDTLRARGSLAAFAGHGGHVDEAVSVLESLLEDAGRALGPNHPITLTTRNQLDYWLSRAGRVEEAMTRSRVLLEDASRVLGPDHPDTLRARHNLARFLGETGRVEEAISQFRALLEDDRRVFGPDHPETLGTRRNLAHFLGEGGRVEDAVAQLLVLLEDHERILGPDSYHTLRVRNNLASWLAKGGRVDEALSQYQALLQDYRRVLGPDHLDTRMTRNDLDRWLSKARQGGRG